MSDKKILVLYHANCPDGFGAAYAAFKKLGESADYKAVNYGTMPPDVTSYERVYILDFSYPRQLLDGMASGGCSVQVIDHHKTAQEALGGFPAYAAAGVVGAIFDMDHSGAVLAWAHFHNEDQVDANLPLFLRYIEDRDLWRWALPYSKEFSAWLASWPAAFMTWPGLEERFKNDFGAVAAEGAALLRAKEQAVKIMADRAVMRDVGGYLVPVANATMFFSEVGEELCIRNPAAPFAAYYFDRPPARQWGLRSRNGFDCSAVAKAKGGGGHPGAAGFEEPLA